MIIADNQLIFNMADSAVANDADSRPSQGVQSSGVRSEIPALDDTPAADPTPAPPRRLFRCFTIPSDPADQPKAQAQALTKYRQLYGADPAEIRTGFGLLWLGPVPVS